MTNTTKQIRIALFGTFDYKNYGDLLFTDVFKAQMSKLLPTAEIVLFSPVGGIKPFTDNEFVHPITDLDKVHNKAPISAIVIGGGDLLRHDNAFVSNSQKYLNNGYTSELWIVPILFANAHKIPVFFNAPGVPFKFDSSLKTFLTDLINSVNYVNVRDETSKKNLEKSIDGIDVCVVPDTISIISETINSEKVKLIFNDIRHLLDLPEKYILFQINTNQLGFQPQDYLPYLRQIKETTKTPIVLMPIGYVHNDMEVLKSIENVSNGEFRMINSELAPNEMFSVIGNAECFIGTSMHGCLTAMIQSVPVVALNFSSLAKIYGCLAMFKMDDNVVHKIEEITPDMLSRKADPLIIKELQTRIKKHFEYIATQISISASIKEDSSLSLFLDIASMMKTFPKAVLVGHIYFDCGDGFSQSNVNEIPIHINGNEFFIDNTVTVPQSCKQFRIDPLEGHLICVSSYSVYNKSKKINQLYHNGVYCDGTIIFPTGDPWIVFDATDVSSFIRIKLSGRFATANDLTLASNLIRKNSAQLQNQLTDLQKNITTMQNSLSWRLTHPIRKILSLFHTK